MKYLFLLAIILLLKPRMAQADQARDPAAASPTPSVSATPTPDNPQGNFYMELAGGIDLPVSGWQSAYSLGPGGEISGGYAFNGNWDVQLDVESFYFSGANDSGNISDMEWLVLPTLRYQWEGKEFKPYVSAGMGAEFEMLSGTPKGLSVSDFDCAAGAGLEAELEKRLSLFVEAKYNFIFSSKVVGQDLPLLAGVHLSL